MKTMNVTDLTFAELKSIYYDLGDAWESSEDDYPEAVEEIEIALTDGSYFDGKSVTWDYPTLYPELWDLMKSKSGPGPK